MSLWAIQPTVHAVTSPSIISRDCTGLGTTAAFWDWHLTTLVCLLIFVGYNAWLLRFELREMYYLAYVYLRIRLMNLGIGICFWCFAHSRPRREPEQPSATENVIHLVELNRLDSDSVAIDIDG